MSTIKFQPPRSIQMIRKRNHEPLNDNKGLFKAYMQSVNDTNEMLDNVESDVKHVTGALRFDIKSNKSLIGPFLIKW